MRRMYHYNSICEVQDVRKVVAKGKLAEERDDKEVECGGEDETKKENNTVDDLKVVLVVVVEAEQEIG